MNPRIWGKSAWDFLYNVAYVYSGEDDLTRSEYRNFYQSLGGVLPCRMCRDNFKEHVQEIPIDDYLSDNKKLIEWLTKIENKVSEKSGGKKVDPIQKFNEIYIKCNPMWYSKIFFLYEKYKDLIILILISGILMYFLFLKNKIIYKYI